MDKTELLHRALDQAERFVAGVETSQLDRPTPCADFDVRALLNHTLASIQGLAEAASGRPWDLSAYGRDLLGDDAQGAFGRAATALRSATADPACLTGTWTMPFGDTPGDTAINIGIMEAAQHSWDIAKATGQADAGAFDDELSSSALALARTSMPPDDQRPESMFGPSVPIADDAPPHDQLAAFLGRTS